MENNITDSINKLRQYNLTITYLSALFISTYILRKSPPNIYPKAGPKAAKPCIIPAKYNSDDVIIIFKAQWNLYRYCK